MLQMQVRFQRVSMCVRVCVCVCVCLSVCLSYPCEDKSHFVEEKSEVQRDKVTCPILI